MLPLKDYYSMTTKPVTFLLPVIIAVLCFLLMLSEASDAKVYSDRVFISSLFIQMFSLYSVFSRPNEPYSLFKIFFLFSLFFLGIAPLFQFLNNITLWSLSTPTESEYFYCNVVIIFISIFFSLFYNLFRKVKIDNNSMSGFVLKKKVSKKISLILIAISAISFLIVLKTNDFSILRMLLRGGEFVTDSTKIVQEDSGAPTSWLIVNNFVRPLSMMCFLFYLVSPNKNFTIGAILFVLALLTCFPTGMPRFAAAAMYIPVLLLTVALFRKQNVFSIAFVCGLLFLFPFLNIFRNFSDTDDIEFKLDMKMFNEGHFDSYQNFLFVLSNDFVTYGRQLLGVIFFWVPRSVWADKPVGSGFYIANELHYSWDNISMNFFAEGYINFGFTGVIIFLLILSYITSVTDQIYWKILPQRKNTFFAVIYTVSLGFLFFILRGDLMSSTAYLLGFLSAAIIVFKIAK